MRRAVSILLRVALVAWLLALTVLGLQILAKLHPDQPVAPSRTAWQGQA